MIRSIKKVVVTMLLLAVTVNFLSVSRVQAENKYFTDENIITECTYSFEGAQDDIIYYKIVPPATVLLNIRVISLDCTVLTGSFKITMYDSNWNESGDFTINSDKTYTLWFSDESPCYLAFSCNSPAIFGDYSFSGKFECFWALSTPTITLKSGKAGKMTVTAPRSIDKEYCDGYEISYRKSGEKWATKRVETTGALQETISGLSKGKTYTVRVRQYVEDNNNKFFYSEWSDKVKIKIKK